MLFRMPGLVEKKLFHFLLLYYNCQRETVKDPRVLFFSSSEFNDSTVGEYFVTIEYNGTISGAQVPKEDSTVEYVFSVYTSDCLYWNTITNSWIGDGCTVRTFIYQSGFEQQVKLVFTLMCCCSFRSVRCPIQATLSVSALIYRHSPAASLSHQTRLTGTK